MPATVTKPEPLSEEKIAGMNRPQLMAEIKTHYERAAEIQKKYPDGPITDKAEEDEVKQLLKSIDRMEDRLAPLEEADERKRRITENVRRYNTAAGDHKHAGNFDPRDQPATSPGQEVIDSAQFKALLESGMLRSQSSRIDATFPIEGSLLQKALVYSGTGVGGPTVFPEFLPGVQVPALFRELTVLDLIARGTTESNLIEYVAETTPATIAAAPTAEATATTGTSGTKPEGAVSYTLVTAPVRTIAWWIPITNRMLSDAPALRAVIDNRLLLGLNLALESQVITGDGTGENFTGILNATGINVTGKTTNDLDAIFNGMTQVRVTGLSRPSGTVLHPIDFQTIRLTRESLATATQGGYLMGPPNIQGATTLWGLPVVQSLGIAQGTGVTGDFQMGAMLFDREEAAVRVGYINDQFTRNLTTLLAELRAAFAVWRGAAFSKVTGL